MFKFYDVDANYIKYLQQYENKVPNVVYSSNNKFVCGVVLTINGIEYYAPISHFNAPQRTNFAIKDKGKIISTIRFCFMFPALMSVLHEKNFDKVVTKDSAYSDLLNTEYEYCRKHLDQIYQRAMSVYKIGIDKTNYYNKNCCDFKLLESVYKSYENKQ